MKNFLVVGFLLVLWLASMLFFMPLFVTVVLFAALASMGSMVIWLTLVERRAGRPRGMIKPENKVGV